MSFANPSKSFTNDLGVHFSSAFDIELRRLIRTRTGIVVQDHQKDNLYSTVVFAMQRYGHSQAESFMASLRSTDKDSPEFSFLITGITVGESYFFRDTNQINFLRDKYLPELIARRAQTGKYLRIWSAGCSDGQELYTLAFLLRDLIPDLDEWRLHLLGTDINTETLTTCLRGHYREWSFRNTPDRIRNEYFHAHDDGYELDEDVQAMARFTYLNLAEDSFPSLLTDTNAIDLILCRNVFIYFDQDTVDKVLQQFRKCLVPDGILMLGASDLVNNNVPGMTLVQDHQTFYYQRQMHDVVSKGKPVERKETPPLESLQAPIAVAKKRSANFMPNEVDSLQQLREYMAQEQWQSIDEAVERCLDDMGQSAELLVYRATAAANLGNLEQANKLCGEALELDPVDKHAHFLSAIVLIELEQESEAKAALRRVLFLDAQFLEAHYQLGLLQLRCGAQKQGIKSLKNALQIAELGNPQYSLHGAADTNFERMAETLRNEIKLHEGSVT